MCLRSQLIKYNHIHRLTFPNLFLANLLISKNNKLMTKTSDESPIYECVKSPVYKSIFDSKL